LDDGNTVATSSYFGGGIDNIVEDTTPQLGGNLDLNGNNITGEGSITISGSTESIELTDTITISANANSDFSSVEVFNRLAVKSPAYGGSRIGDAYLQTPSLDIGYNPSYTDSGAINFKSGSNQQTVAGMFTNPEGTVFTIKGFDDSIMVVDHTSIDAVSGSDDAESTIANTITFTNTWSYINDQGVQIYPNATTPVAETHFQILQNRNGAPRMGFYKAFYDGTTYDRIYSILSNGDMEYDNNMLISGSLTANSVALIGNTGGQNFLLDDGNTVATSSYFGGGNTVATSSYFGGGIDNIVEDTTPQLGGNLDLNSNNITGTGSIDILNFNWDGNDLTVTDNSSGLYQLVLEPATGYEIHVDNISSGGWSRGLIYKDTSNSIWYEIGALGNQQSFTYAYLGTTFNDTALKASGSYIRIGDGAGNSTKPTQGELLNVGGGTLVVNDDNTITGTANVTLDGGNLIVSSSTVPAISVTGSIEATGEIEAFASSDERLKLNMEPISEPLVKLQQIGGYTYDWDETKKIHMTGKDVGVSAQEIQKVLPEVVKEKYDGYLGVRYEKIVPLLIEANKELLKRVEELERRLNEK